jgi:hypothetical protein
MIQRFAFCALKELQKDTKAQNYCRKHRTCSALCQKHRIISMKVVTIIALQYQVPGKGKSEESIQSQKN